MADAAMDIRSAAETSASDPPLRCSVSVDGSWQRRGYCSLNGIVTAMSLPEDIDRPGKVLDVAVLTKNCKQCHIYDELPHNSVEYLRWKSTHVCSINHEGSAGSMETEGAKQIFNSSIEKHKLIYENYLGDGDSKGHNSVVGCYGPDVEVKKLQCVGHVQKRVGKRLRNLKKKTRGLGGRGKLTDVVIDKLQNYYGLAVRQNKGNQEAMKQDIMASLYHVASSDEKPQHDKCPQGENTWCKYWKSKAEGTEHNHKGKGLSDDIVKAVLPIYEDLTKETLLAGCLHGRTQNQNEAINQLYWIRCPKSVFVGKDVLDLAVADAIIVFNCGMRTCTEVLSHMGLEIGLHCYKAYSLIDNYRMQKAKRNASGNRKMRRKYLRWKIKGRQEWCQEKEGTVYESGAL